MSRSRLLNIHVTVQNANFTLLFYTDDIHFKFVGVYILQLIPFSRVCFSFIDFNNRNQFVTAKLSKQGYRIKIRKAFSTLKVVIIVTLIVGVCNCSMCCCTLLYVHTSIAIILMGKRELVALLNLSSWCLAMPWGCLWSF